MKLQIHLPDRSSNLPHFHHHVNSSFNRHFLLLFKKSDKQHFVNWVCILFISLKIRDHGASAVAFHSSSLQRCLKCSGKWSQWLILEPPGRMEEAPSSWTLWPFGEYNSRWKIFILSPYPSLFLFACVSFSLCNFVFQFNKYQKYKNYKYENTTT